MLARLNQAWTATDGCAANPATAGNATVGGPAPYWQSWTFDQLGDRLSQTDHAVAGSTTGDTTTGYAYGVAGHAHAVASTTAKNSVTGSTTTDTYGYDSSGDTTTRGLSTGSETVTWNQNGKMSSDVNAAGTTSFAYDADGNELVRNDPGSSTLYLPGEQLTYNASTAATTGMRYYTFAGKTIGQANGSILYWVEGDLHGTMTVAVNAFSQSSVIRRATTPYGTVRGTGAGTWPDDRTFLGDAHQSATGLVDVGARKYDPALGAFISVDPKLDPADPQTMTGYTYSAENPVDGSDPTGLMRMLPDGGDCWTSCGGDTSSLSPSPSPSPSPPPTPYVAPDPVMSFIGPLAPGVVRPPVHPPWVNPLAGYASGTCGTGSWPQYACSAAGGVTSVAGGAMGWANKYTVQGGVADALQGKNAASVLKKANKLLDAINDAPGLSNFVGHNIETIDTAGRFLGPAGLAAGVVYNYDQDRDNGESKTRAAVTSVAQGAADTFISGEAVAEGFGIGLAVGGPVGAAVGTGVGLVVGFIGSNVANNLISDAGNVVSDIASWF